MINVISFAKPKQTSGGVSSSSSAPSYVPPSGGSGIGMHTIWGNNFDGTQDVEGDLTITGNNLRVDGGNVEMLSSVWTTSYFKFLQTTDEPYTSTDEEGNETISNGEYSRLVASNCAFNINSTNDASLTIVDGVLTSKYETEDNKLMSGIFFDEPYYKATSDKHATRIRKYDINTGIVNAKQLNVENMTVTGKANTKYKYYAPAPTTLDATAIINYDIFLYTDNDAITVTLPIPSIDLSGRRVQFKHLSGHDITYTTPEGTHIYVYDGNKLESVTSSGFVEAYYFYVDENLNGIIIR